ncbi:hypothetical protein EL22_26295 [Halostagnicola sp. A56]|nr:hypothetical protein EL22_26295 [Halostagnicola sp. A56]
MAIPARQAEYLFGSTPSELRSDVWVIRRNAARLLSSARVRIQKRPESLSGILRKFQLMKQPYGRCEDCGERLYEHIDGGYRCGNCGTRYDESVFDGDSASVEAAVSAN